MTRRLAIATLACLTLAACPSREKPQAAKFPSFEARPATPSPRFPEPSPRYRLAGPFLFFEDFEPATNHWENWWEEGGAEGGPARWFLLKAPACGGAFVAFYGQPGQTPFLPAQDDRSWRYDRPIDLTRARHPQLTYTVMAQASPPETLSLQPEVRVGEGPWKAVGIPGMARYRTAYTRFADLSDYAGRKIELRFRLRARAGGSETKGFYLDDVQIIEPAGS